jgi:AcrR family transcriptional regulator
MLIITLLTSLSTRTVYEIKSTGMPLAVRQRRTPEEARELILSAAQLRLSAHGVRGLTIKDVAADTGINHGTLLHHFGSAEEMRTALLVRMTDQLVGDMAEVLESGIGPKASVVALFNLMSTTGHTKLLAWRAMEDVRFDGVELPVNSTQSITSIIDRITAGLSDPDQQTARNMVYLAVSTAVGWGICGPGFQKMLGLSPTQQEDFPAWVGTQIASLSRLD